MDFKYNIKRLRIENGLTQEELANNIGVSQSAVYLWENGKSDITGSYLVCLARFLNVSTDEILGLEPLPATSDKGVDMLSVFNSMTEKQKDLCLQIAKIIACQKE